MSVRFGILIRFREKQYGQVAGADVKPTTGSIDVYGRANQLVAIMPNAFEFASMPQIDSLSIPFDQIRAILRNLLEFTRNLLDPKRIYDVEIL